MNRNNRYLHQVLALLISVVIAFSVNIGDLTAEATYNEADAKYLSIAETQYSLYPDVADSRYNEAIGVLNSLGIMTTDGNGNFFPENKVSRGEMALIIARVMGINNIYGKSYESKYQDVTKSHQYYKEICAVTDLGYMNGKGEGVFDPDGSVSRIELAKVLVKMTGYDIVAEKQGGFPQGYLAVASKYDIIAGTGDMYDALTRIDFAEMLFRAMNIPIMDSTVITNNSAQFEIVDNQSLLTKRFNVYYGTGKLSDDGFTTLIGNSVVGEDRTVISNVNFAKGNVNTEGYIGCKVSFYYQDNFDDKKLLTIKPETMEKLTVKGDVIEGTINNLTYKYEGQQRKKIAISDDFKIIYNSKAYSGYTAAELNRIIKPSSGEVTFIDTDGNGKYDIISIISLQTYVVNYISTSPTFIIGDIHGRAELPELFGEENKVIRAFRDGKEISPQMILQNNVISVAASKDKEIINIYVSTEIVNGKIDGLDDGNPVINNKVYKVNQSYTEITADPEKKAPSLALGLSAKFYLDAEGKIANVVQSSTTVSKYAYLYDAYLPERGKKTIELMLFTGEGKWIETVFTERAKFNGESVKGNETVVIEALRGKPQLVTYVCDGENKVTALNTVAEIQNGDLLQNSLIQRPVLDSDLKSRRFRSNANGIYLLGVSNNVTADIFMDNDTKIFVVPGNPEEIENYAVSTPDKLTGFMNKTTFPTEGYDMDEFDVASVVVAYNETLGNSVSTSSAYVVEKIIAQMQPDGEYRDVLYATGETQRIITVIKNDAGVYNGTGNKLRKTHKDIKSGDVIMIGIDRDTGEIETIRQVVSVDDLKKEIYDGKYGHHASNPQITSGLILGRNNRWIRLGIGDDIEQTLGTFGTVRAYAFDCETQTLRPIKLDAVRENDVCAAVCRSLLLTFFVVYEF